MPHVHTLTIFDVDRIDIRFDAECNCYSIRLITGPNDYGAETKLNIWRDAEGGPKSELFIEGWNTAQLEEAAK